MGRPKSYKVIYTAVSGRATAFFSTDDCSGYFVEISKGEVNLIEGCPNCGAAIGFKTYSSVARAIKDMVEKNQ